MKNSPVALLAALLLLLSACGTNDSAEVSAAEEIQTTPGAVADDVGVEDASTDPATDQPLADGDKESADPTEGQAEDEAPQEAVGSAATLQSVVLATDTTSPNSASSAQFEATVSMTGAPGSEIPGQFSLRMAGAYDLTRDASRVSIDMSDLARLATESADADSDLGFMAAFLEDDIEMITIGDQAWIKWSLLTMFTGAGDKWLEGSADDTGDVTADIGVQGTLLPSELLDVWADTPGDVEDLGTETIRGSEVAHYRFTFDADELAAISSDAEWRALEEDMGIDIVGLVPLDVWVDEDGQLHRYMMELDAPAGDEVLAASFTFEIWDHGNDVGITPPAAEDVITEDQLTFGFDEDGTFGESDGFDELLEDFES